MTEPEYRRVILNRLQERDRFAGQFTRIVLSYLSITDSLNLLNLNKRQRQNSTSSRNDSRDIAELQEKLDRVIAKKSENDQQLIDATKKIVDLEARLSAVTETKGELEHQLREVREQLRKREEELRELQHSKQEIADEVLALNALNRQLELKFVDADQERVTLLERLKQMKEEQIKFYNDFNDKEQQIRLERQRFEISEAIKNTPAIAATVSTDDGRNRRASESGSVGSMMSAGFDEVPSRCFYKTECDDNGEVNDCCFNRTGKYFFTAGTDKTVRMYQLEGDRATLRTKLIGFSAGINRLDVNRDLPILLAASNDKTIRVYNIDDQRLKCALTGHSDKVSSARFLTNANRILSGSLDRTVKIWDSMVVRCVKTYFPGSTCTDVAASDGTQMLLSSHFDKNIRFWDQRSDTPVASVKFDGKITSLCISPDGNKVLAACRDETLLLVDLRVRIAEHIYSADQFRTSYDYAKCMVSPSMQYVAAGSADGQIFIWNLHTTKLEKILQRGGHEANPVYSLAFHPTSRIMLSTDRRRTCCLWD
ncbi:hypothetical protein M3Y94_00910300 [Aphelenchoides besseyi]|nr:hypothetical protein M3Y94_00910300 [Aphelenchoides besseyi]KAI6223254.1 ATG16 domain-containing protein [Aphelenchoides besseyi]